MLPSISTAHHPTAEVEWTKVTKNSAGDTLYIDFDNINVKLSDVVCHLSPHIYLHNTVMVVFEAEEDMMEQLSVLSLQQHLVLD